MLRATRLAMGLVIGVLAATPVWADLEIGWWTIDGGGGTGTAGQLHLVGTIGQPDASTLSGGGLTLTGGFWALSETAGIPCTGDLNGNGSVDLSDLATLLSNFGTLNGASASMGDTDGDGDIDLTDLSVLLANFGVVC